MHKKNRYIKLVSKIWAGTRQVMHRHTHSHTHIHTRREISSLKGRAFLWNWNGALGQQEQATKGRLMATPLFFSSFFSDQQLSLNQEYSTLFSQTFFSWNHRKKKKKNKLYNLPALSFVIFLRPGKPCLRRATVAHTRVGRKGGVVELEGGTCWIERNPHLIAIGRLAESSPFRRLHPFSFDQGEINFIWNWYFCDKYIFLFGELNRLGR